MMNYILADYYSHPLRALCEALGMVIAVSVSILLAATTPTVPLLWCYSGWLTSALLLGTCSWHRGSVGLTATYASFFFIDSIGLLRTLGLWL